MLLFSGKSNPSGRKMKNKGQENYQGSNQKDNFFAQVTDLDQIGEQMAEGIVEGNEMQADECPEYFDEFEFDEEMPVAEKRTQA